MLPLGSVVKLKGNEGKLVIYCRYPLYKTEKKEGYCDYAACLFPFGQMGPESIFFNSEDIDTVVHTGYTDEEEDKFLEAAEKSLKETGYQKIILKKQLGNII